jgi:hypothetical protein
MFGCHRNSKKENVRENHRPGVPGGGVGTTIGPMPTGPPPLTPAGAAVDDRGMWILT